MDRRVQEQAVPSSDHDSGSEASEPNPSAGERPGENEVDQPGDDESPVWPVLRAIAETQRDMAARLNGGGESKRNLANIRLDEFYGGTGVSARTYRMWKKSVLAKARLHRLTDSELALVIYTEVKGKAKELLEILEISDLEGPDGLEMVWQILDQAHEKMEHERADDAYDGWENARRKHGQSMEEWISYIKKIKLEMEAHDEDVVISAKQMASKMLRGSGLPSEKCAQVLFNAGGKYVPDRIATVLRVTYPRLHEAERRSGQVVPRARQASMPTRSGGQTGMPSRQAGPTALKAGMPLRGADGRYKQGVRPKGVHAVDDLEDADDVEFPVGDSDPDAESDGNQDNGEHDDENNNGFDDDDPEDVQELTEQEAKEAFLAGWRAKKKTSDQRKQRGFLGVPRSDRTELSQSCPGKLDVRKTNSRCADCKGLGHWRGDPECPLVQAGQVPKFEKPVKKAHYVRWLGMVNKVEPVRVVKAEHVREDLWHVYVGFIHKKLVDHVLDRLSKKKPIFFGTKSQGGLIEEYVRKEPLSVTFFAKSRGELQVSVVQEAFMKVLGPSVQDQDVQLELEILTKEERNKSDDVCSSHGSFASCSSHPARHVCSSWRKEWDERVKQQRRSKQCDRDVPQHDEQHRDTYHQQQKLRKLHHREASVCSDEYRASDQDAGIPPSVHGLQQSRKRSSDESSHCVSRALGLKVCSERVPGLIEKWRKRQDLFGEYEPKPMCIHVLVDNCVWRLNIFTERLFEPDMVVREGSKKVFMLSSVPGRSSDWTMAEYSDEAQRREQVAAAKAIDKVRHEKKELMRKIEELAAQEEDLIEMSGDLRAAPPSSIRGVHAELSHRRRAEMTEVPISDEETGGAGAVWKNMQGTYSSKSRATRPSAQPSAQPVFVDEEGVKYMGTKPTLKTAGEESKDRTRRQLYEAQCVDGKFQPGPRTKYDAKNLNGQVACEHPFECLRWGANSSTAYASCTSCGARTVIHHWVERPEKPQKNASEKPRKSQSSNSRRSPDTAFMLNQPESGKTTELFVVKVPRGMAMIDTGCRAAVGGARWHAELQKVMKTLGKSFTHEPQEEYFQFGPGDPILSRKRWIYKVGVLGRECELVISEVPVECPGLLGPDELAAWNVTLNFQDKSYYSDGQRGEMIFTSSGHPCMDLSAFPSSSFLASTIQRSSGKSGSNHRELLSLLERTADQVEHYNIFSDDDVDSDFHGTNTEESSHVWTSESEHWTTPSTEEDMQGAFLTGADRGDRKWMRKGARRHVRGAIGTIQQTMREEAKVFNVQRVLSQSLLKNRSKRCWDTLV